MNNEKAHIATEAESVIISIVKGSWIGNEVLILSTIPSVRNSAGRIDNRRTTGMYTLLMTPEDTAGPRMTGISLTESHTPIRRTMKIISRIILYLLYRQKFRFNAIIDSKSAAFSADSERVSICRAKYLRWNFSLSFNCGMS